jgi:peptidoglycan/LPS O-acetylase OafA/YrhL
MKTLRPRLGTSSNMQSSNNSNLDFLRAVAVFFVCFAHLTYFRGIYRLGPLNVVPIGFWGVLVFFVHTSLVLMLSLERQWNQSGGSKFFLIFMLRRCFRIFPVSILVVALIALFHFPLAVVERGNFVGASMTLWTIICNIFLIQNLANQASILGPLWSLPYEMQMYLFLPFLFLLIRSTGAIWRSLLLWMLSISIAVVALRHKNVPDLLLFIPCFLPGVIAFQLMRTKRLQVPAFLWPLAIALLTIFFLAEPGWPFRWAACLILGIAIPRFAPLKNHWLVAASHTTAKYSYGIYLTHFFSIWLAFEHLRSLSKIEKALVFGACSIGLPLLFYHLIEEPMIQLGKRIADHIQTLDVSVDSSHQRSENRQIPL